MAPLAALTLAIAGPAGAHRCTGDCDASDTVTIQELIQGVRIAIGQLEVEVCYQFDVDLDGRVSVDELRVAIGNVFSWCGHGSPPTPTATRTATRTPTTSRTTTPTATPSATASPAATSVGSPSDLTVRRAGGYGSEAAGSGRRGRLRCRGQRDGNSRGSRGECG